MRREPPASSRQVGEQGWRSGRALASHQCGPGSIPGVDTISGLSLLLVLVPAPRVFSPSSPVFLPPQKPTFPNSNSTWKQWTNSYAVDVPLKVPFIYFIFIYYLSGVIFIRSGCKKDVSMFF